MLEKLPEALGHALIHQRAGLEKIAFHQTDLRATLGAIEVRSVAFSDHAPIPARYTADGEGLSPPLHWSGLPTATAAVLLIVEDADAPTPQPLVHAIVVDLPPDEAALGEGAIASPDHESDAVKAGRNSFLSAAWLPPDPPPGHGVHRYAFQVFALAAGGSFSETPGREEVLDVVRRFGLASGLLIGTYERPDTSIKDPAVEAETAGIAPMLVAS